MLTADNIADEQIRELLHLCRRDLDAGDNIITLGICEVALGLRRNRHGKNQRAKARARCAEILNARAKEQR
jgi:hypothetical protein